LSSHLVYGHFVIIDVDKMSVVQMIVDEMTVNYMTVDKITVDKNTVDKIGPSSLTHSLTIK